CVPILTITRGNPVRVPFLRANMDDETAILVPLHGFTAYRIPVLRIGYEIVVFAIKRDAPPACRRIEAGDLIAARNAQLVARIIAVSGEIDRLVAIEREKPRNGNTRARIGVGLCAANGEVCFPGANGNIAAKTAAANEQDGRTRSKDERHDKCRNKLQGQLHELSPRRLPSGARLLKPYRL